MEPLVFRNARFKYALVFLISLVFAASGLFLLFAAPHQSPRDRWIAGSVSLFFGSCAAVFAWQIFDNRPRLTIDDLGIDDRTLGVGKIPWSEITTAYRQSIRCNEFICLEVRNPECGCTNFHPRSEPW